MDCSYLCIYHSRNTTSCTVIYYFLWSPTLNIEVEPYTAAVVGFSLNVGAYASEIIRASILSIPKGQWEAAYTIGMTYPQALKRVILPQATRISIPPLSNTFISLVKDTSLASLILVTEMFRNAGNCGDELRVFNCLF